MKNHSMIFDDFFDDPFAVKAMLAEEPMTDVTYDDGVTYPNICILPPSVEKEILEKLRRIFGPITPKIMFARYSFEDTKPPHWAHSDREIAEFLALIYMNEGHPECGTAVVQHSLGFETHPKNMEEAKVLLQHANEFDMWEVTYDCPSRFNRLFVLNAELIHAAMGEYGSTRDDGRLVISVFFDGAK